MGYGHGKVILFGEHAVVQGKPALVMAVPFGAQVEAQLAERGPTTLHIAPWNVDLDTGAEPNPGRERLQQALRVARGAFERDFALRAHVTVPSAAGMGSSAALAVGVLRAMAEASGQALANDALFRHSLDWEDVFHGRPSGIDNAVAIHGGILLFQKSEDRYLPVVQPVVPRHRPCLLAGYSGEKHDARELVMGLIERSKRDPAHYQKQFDAIEAIVNNGRRALEQGDLRDLGQLMTMNHMLLSGFMLSTPKIEEMIAAAKAAGALGAKITGAGGGGCMIALAESCAARGPIAEALTPFGPVYHLCGAA